MDTMEPKTYTAIDLFSGAGGFSLGMEQAGFNVRAALDSDSHAADTYRKNMPSADFFQENISKFGPEVFSEQSGIKKIDVIFGGPPCQGFSLARPDNHGLNVIADKRRSLYKQFLKYVHHFRPKIFVMENVPGIVNTDKGRVLSAIIKDIENTGYTVLENPICAWRFGVPQKRKRHIIAGFRRDIRAPGENWIPQTHADSKEKISGGLKPPTTLWEAISDLPVLRAGESADKYDMRRREDALEFRPHYLKNVLQIGKAKELTGHTARHHSDRDLRDFARLDEGQSSAEALRKGVKMEFPYNRKVFRDRYTKQHRNRLCSTILAHISKDGLMYIHPTQTRSLTPREAARIQSFPDWFVFPCPRSQQYRLIGNAVPPLMARAIGKAVKRHLDSVGFHKSAKLISSAAA